MSIEMERKIAFRYAVLLIAAISGAVAAATTSVNPTISPMDTTTNLNSSSAKQDSEVETDDLYYTTDIYSGLNDSLAADSTEAPLTVVINVTETTDSAETMTSSEPADAQNHTRSAKTVTMTTDGDSTDTDFETDSTPTEYSPVITRGSSTSNPTQNADEWTTESPTQSEEDESTTELTTKATTTDEATSTSEPPLTTREYEPSSVSISPEIPMTSSSESNEVPRSLWFVLLLDGCNCSLIRNEGTTISDQIVEEMKRRLELDTNAIYANNEVTCKMDRIYANVTVLEKAGLNVTAQMKDLEASDKPLLTLQLTDGQEVELYLYKIGTSDGYFSKEPDIPTDVRRHSDVELVIYIAVGSICAFLLLLAVVLLACKYCECCKDQKPYEFGEMTPPNLNMRLEDYTLTRIPRPKLGYVDYYRGLSKRYSPLDDKIVVTTSNGSGGMVQPFDTSVVPLEDARALDVAAASNRSAGSSDFRDGVIVRPSDIHRFGSSFSRIYSRAGKNCKQERDSDGYVVRSTENLHRAYQNNDKYVDKGVDNPNFQ